jgi:hypothetical protein
MRAHDEPGARGGRKVGVALAALGVGMGLALGGCSGTRGKAAVPGLYVSEADRFSIVPPVGWEKKEGMMGTAVAFLEARQGDSDDFRENVNIYVENLPARMDLAGYAKASDANVEKLLTGYERIQSGAVKLNGQDARRTVYKHKMGVFDLQALSYLLVKDGRGYVITCSAKADAYKDHEPIFERACQTFHAD